MNRVVSAIQSAAQTTGAGFDYLLRTAQRESSLQPSAQAPTSSARGLYQFIDTTWLTMVRDEGRKLGLERYAAQIGSNSNGQPVVADAATRQQILALRDDPKVAALMAGAFTNRNAADLRAATGRNPTEGELYMAHFLGSGGASRLIGLNQTNPQAIAARAFPDAAGANRRIFFDNGRPRTVAEVYGLLSSGQTTAVAGASPAATVQPAAASPAVAPETESDRGSWSAVPRMNANPNRPFHSMFASGAGPINAFVSATWASLGRGASTREPVTAETALAQTSTSAPSVAPPVAAPVSTVAPANGRAPVGGPFMPVRTEPAGRSGPLDLSQFRRTAEHR
ncbi:lytic transglycosylase domain-containing protein [Phreatobacter stygius]|uniref:Lytic transglycosylase domain-containing protein n=1 Tax=Phreatobacter stygius TaxID=1940610 RepID=A0A4D7BBM4_9HYPH|nr:lytic transglycosylase domain-containing protein [Phreatobacter stygius]QCI68120.1 lytic transglycosylase domain-containing protein [Phreatobacter stygius]